jgi:hypothetical protein
MIRKSIIAIAATSAVAAVALPTAASAHGWHHRHGGGGWGGIYIGIGEPTYASCYGYEWRQNRRGQWYQVLVRYC